MTNTKHIADFIKNLEDLHSIANGSTVVEYSEMLWQREIERFIDHPSPQYVVKLVSQYRSAVKRSKIPTSNGILALISTPESVRKERNAIINATRERQRTEKLIGSSTEILNIVRSTLPCLKGATKAIEVAAIKIGAKQTLNSALEYLFCIQLVTGLSVPAICSPDAFILTAQTPKSKSHLPNRQILLHQGKPVKPLLSDEMVYSAWISIKSCPHSSRWFGLSKLVLLREIAYMSKNEQSISIYEAGASLLNTKEQLSSRKVLDFYKSLA